MTRAALGPREAQRLLGSHRTARLCQLMVRRAAKYNPNRR
jgi:hypothetical protein